MSKESSYPVNEEGWPLVPEGYQLIEEIGQGAFAKVVKSYCPSKSVHVAIKIMALENIFTSMEEIQSEVKAMKLAKHENVTDLYCCFVVGSNLWLVMPLMDKGSCYYIIRSLRRSGRLTEGQGLPEDVIATVIRELLQGLEYIHNQGQIHRDIKAGNILMNSEGRVAIADFGVAGWITESGSRDESVRKTFVGTPCWMAPEVMDQIKGYNEKADIWSVGITALELAKGRAPYSVLSPMQVLIKTIREPPPSIKSYIDPPGVPQVALSDKFHKFVSRCLQKDPAARPSAHDLLSDPFIKKSMKLQRLNELLLAEVPSVGTNKTMEDNEVASKSEAPALVPGTTWVFPDDFKSQVESGSARDGFSFNRTDPHNVGSVVHPVDGPQYADGPEYSSIHESGSNYSNNEDDTSLDAIAAELEALGGENL